MTTPKMLSIFLRLKHVKQNEITVEHVSQIYTKLKPWKGSSNEESIEKVSQMFTVSLATVESIGDDFMGVIVETRAHKDLEFVINNFIKNTGLRVQLFHGYDNLSFIQSTSLSKYITQNQVILTLLPCSELTESYYNALFLNIDFWKTIKGRLKILIFQTDSVVCNNSKYNICDFLHFDYIGPQWFDRLRPNGIVLDGGVGGFSLRDYSKSIDCLERFPGNLWQGGEDNYFAFHIELIGGKVAKKNDSAKFCTQNKFIYKSFAAHQISNLSKVDKSRFLLYCPESKFLL